MNVYVVAAIVVGVLLAGVVVLAAARRRDTGEAIGQLSRETRRRDTGEGPVLEDAQAGPTGKEIERATRAAQKGGIEPYEEDRAPVPFAPPDDETIGVTRRQFFNRSVVGFMGLSLASFGAACIAFLWPPSAGGFGSKIRVGKVDEIKSEIEKNNGFLYLAEGKMWITEYPAGALKKAEAVYSPPELAGMEAGLVALYQKCPHLGCRVPECISSQWFECPCHGSRYNQVGEKRGGPAPRGMDRFAMSVEGGTFVVDTGTIIPGPPIGTNTTGQEAEGPSCLGASTHG